MRIVIADRKHYGSTLETGHEKQRRNPVVEFQFTVEALLFRFNLQIKVPDPAPKNRLTVRQAQRTFEQNIVPDPTARIRIQAISGMARLMIKFHQKILPHQGLDWAESLPATDRKSPNFPDS
jgi:hypothetical protein